MLNRKASYFIKSISCSGLIDPMHSMRQDPKFDTVNGYKSEEECWKAIEEVDFREPYEFQIEDYVIIKVFEVRYEKD